MTDIPPLSKQKKYWDDWVGRSFTWEDYAPNKRKLVYILEEVNKCHRKDMKILDVGCGSGWLARELQRFGEVTAVDLSAKAIQELQTKFAGIKWIAADILSTEFSETQYDVVTCLEAIAHVPDQEAFGHRLAQVTRPGGILLLTTQNEYIWSRTSWLGPPEEGQIRNWPSRERLIQLLGSYFSIEKIATCAPGGDRGMPRLVNNRLANAVGRLLLSEEKWNRLRESYGFGQSLFLVGKRR